MSSAVSLAFTIGVFAVLTSCALPLAVAAIGLGASQQSSGSARAALRRGVVSGALAACAFLSVLLVAAGFEAAGAEISNHIPAVALLIALGVIALGARILTGRDGGGLDDGAYAIFGVCFGIVSLPGSLWLLQGIIELTAEARGTSGAVASVVLFAAGTFAALIALALVAELFGVLVRRLGGAGPVLAGAVAIAGGVASVLYWIPALVDGIEERGGAIGDAVTAVAGEIAYFAATYHLLFALLLLAAALAALLAQLRPPVSKTGTRPARWPRIPGS